MQLSGIRGLRLNERINHKGSHRSDAFGTRHSDAEDLGRFGNDCKERKMVARRECSGIGFSIDHAMVHDRQGVRRQNVEQIHRQPRPGDSGQDLRSLHDEVYQAQSRGLIARRGGNPRNDCRPQPKARNRKAEEFMDTSLMAELDKSGFLKAAWQ
jgi:hypothetical protein